MKTILNKNNRIYFQHRNKMLSTGFFFFMALIIWAPMQAQTDKRLVLADQYFAAGEFVTAAGLYGQYLNPAVKSKNPSGFPLNSGRNTGGNSGPYKSKTDILLKQAESMRLANYWNEAAVLYKQGFEKDSSSYGEALYWYAVCTGRSGKYDEAERNLDQFITRFSDGSSYHQQAIEEKQRLRFIKDQMARPDTVLYHIQKVQTSFGQTRGLFAPVSIGNSQFMFTSTQTDSVAKGVNPNHNRLFTSRYSNGSFEQLQPIGFVFDASLNQAAASMGMQGNRIYFTQWTKENGHTVSSICQSTKTAGSWSKPEIISSLNARGSNSRQPFCTPDNRYIFFASDGRGGQGGFDIWYAAIQADGTISEPVNCGPGINTSGNEQAPFYHQPTHTLVFATDRMPGMGGYDLYAAKGEMTTWESPKNLGYPVNSTQDDIYFFSDGKSLLENAFISSDRSAGCCLETYAISKTPKKKLLTGLIRDCGTHEPIASAAVVLKDGTGNLLKTTTETDGTYSFEWTASDWNTVSMIKEKYIDKSGKLNVERTSDAGWFTDTLFQSILCIDKKVVIKMEDVVTVYFDYDDSRLRPLVREKLDSIFLVLEKDTLATIQISGYSDGKGSVQYNKVLSEKRAKACADYLVKKGIAARRIRFESFGACCPVEMELINGRDNNDARSLNRRALINISRD